MLRLSVLLLAQAAAAMAICLSPAAAAVCCNNPAAGYRAHHFSMRANADARTEGRSTSTSLVSKSPRTNRCFFLAIPNKSNTHTSCLCQIGKPSLPGAACSALGGSGGAPRVVLLGRGSSFPLPPRKARDTHKSKAHKSKIDVGLLKPVTGLGEAGETVAVSVPQWENALRRSGSARLLKPHERAPEVGGPTRAIVWPFRGFPLAPYLVSFPCFLLVSLQHPLVSSGNPGKLRGIRHLGGALSRV